MASQLAGSVVDPPVLKEAKLRSRGTSNDGTCPSASAADEHGHAMQDSSMEASPQAGPTQNGEHLRKQEEATSCTAGSPSHSCSAASAVNLHASSGSPAAGSSPARQAPTSTHQNGPSQQPRKQRQRSDSVEGCSDRGCIDDTGLHRSEPGQSAMSQSAGEGSAPAAAGSCGHAPVTDATSAGDQDWASRHSGRPAGATHADSDSELILQSLQVAARAHVVPGPLQSDEFRAGPKPGPRAPQGHSPPSAKGIPQNGKHGTHGSGYQNGKVRNGMRPHGVQMDAAALMELAGLLNGGHGDEHSSSTSSDSALQALMEERTKAGSPTGTSPHQSEPSLLSQQSPPGEGVHHPVLSHKSSLTRSMTAPLTLPEVEEDAEAHGPSSHDSRGNVGSPGAWSDAPGASAGPSHSGGHNSGGTGGGGGSYSGSQQQRNYAGRGTGGWVNSNGNYGMPGGASGLSRRGRGSYGNLSNASSTSGGGKQYSMRNGSSNQYRPGYNSNRNSMDDAGMVPQRPASRGPPPMHMPRDREMASVGVQASMDMNLPPGCGAPHEPDLDRFISQVTPLLQMDCTGRTLEQVLTNLRLEDVWRFYEEPSLYGREVYTLGGARGPSLCYFVPYLSAMQLFTPASSKDRGTNRLHICDIDMEGWPKHMHLRFEHFETELPFNRHPMYEQIDILSQQQAAQAAAAAAAAAASGSQPAPAMPRSQSSAQVDALVSGTPPVAAGVQAVSAPPTTVAGSEKSYPASTHEGSPGTPSHVPSSAASSRSASRRASEAGSVSGAAANGPASRAEGSEQPTAPSAGGALPLPPGGQLLRDMRIMELHPASWYAVAWYPVYRIPDAPLVTRFLTFHSFAPLVTSIQNALASLRTGGDIIPLPWSMPVCGLKWYNMHGERWLEPLYHDPSGQVTSMRDEPPSTYGGRGGGRRQLSQAQYVQARNVDIQWQHMLQVLQDNAERLARGHGLRLLGQMGAEELRIRHPDYEFFVQRS